MPSTKSPKAFHKSRTVQFNTALAVLLALSQNTELLAQVAVAAGLGGGVVVPAIALVGVIGNVVLRAVTDSPIKLPGTK